MSMQVIKGKPIPRAVTEQKKAAGPKAAAAPAADQPKGKWLTMAERDAIDEKIFQETGMSPYVKISSEEADIIHANWIDSLPPEDRAEAERLTGPAKRPGKQPEIAQKA